MNNFRGFVLIVVNVASKCGYTDKHYKELNELNEKYHEKGLRILAFPCNQFGDQVTRVKLIVINVTTRTRNIIFEQVKKMTIYAYRMNFVNL